MKVRFHRTEDRELIHALHTICFPTDEWIGERGKRCMWLGEDEAGTPVAFCIAKKLQYEEGVFLERAGVLPYANGNGLQRRMIRLRERWAREIEAPYILTYAQHDNHASIVNLLRCGYKLYTPSYAWGGLDSHHFIKYL